MKLSRITLIIAMLFFSFSANSTIGDGHVSGKITNITSVGSGLLVRIGANEVPRNCTSGAVWMEIKQANTAMISLTLTAWTLGKNVDVYVSPATNGYCQVWQLDPSG